MAGYTPPGQVCQDNTRSGRVPPEFFELLDTFAIYSKHDIRSQSHNVETPRSTVHNKKTRKRHDATRVKIRRFVQRIHNALSQQYLHP